MSNQPLVLQIPEDLVRRAEATGVDMRRVLIEALEKEVARRQGAASSLMALIAEIDAMPDDLKPTPDEINEMVRQVRAESYEKHRKSTAIGDQ